jgi:tetratricopeptide (TPR) repeat protein
MAPLSPPEQQTQAGSAQPGPATAIPEISRSALLFHQRGQLFEAEQLYRRILDLDPRHSDSLHLLGVLAHQVGREDVAIELIGKAIAVDKKQAAYHSNLGTALQASGRMDEAAVSYRNALALKPQMAEAHLNLGALLQTLGKIDEAEARFRQALAIKPDLAEAYVNLGNILLEQGKMQQGNLDEAAACQEKALALKPDSVEAQFNLGNVRQAQGNHEEAVRNYERALALNPNFAEVHSNLGNTLLAQNKLDEAVASYERALALKPEYADACYNLGNARQAQDKLDEAITCYRRALTLKPHLAEAHYNLGNTLHTLERLEEALVSFESALQLRPDYAEAHYNLGCTLQDLGKLEQALASMAKALEIQPEYPQARFAHALTQLQLGDFSAGWLNYETRWDSADHHTPRRAYPQPLWKGEKLEAGRLLLWGEQGVGDEIMFAGLIPDALRIGNRIVLDCEPRLQPLFARSFPEIEVISSKESGQPSTAASRHAVPSDFTVHLPTGSLPLLFRRSEDAFAKGTSPYLRPDPIEQTRFRSAYGEKSRLIGLAWSTTNPKSGRKRSVDLARLAPLFAQENLRWVSLQYGDFDTLTKQAAVAQAPLFIDRNVDQLADIDRFASQVAAMDLVITIDNSTAHLAGALGIPVWLLLPFASDWRWLQSGAELRSDSPWYPTLRIFRQTQVGDWTPVVTEVQKSLELL